MLVDSMLFRLLLPAGFLTGSVLDDRRLFCERWFIFCKIQFNSSKFNVSKFIQVTGARLLSHFEKLHKRCLIFISTNLNSIIGRNVKQFGKVKFFEIFY